MMWKLLIFFIFAAPCVALHKLHQATLRTTLSKTAALPICDGNFMSGDCPVGTVGCMEGHCAMQAYNSGEQPKYEYWYKSCNSTSGDTYPGVSCQTDSDCCDLLDGTSKDEYTACFKDPDAPATCTVSEDPHVTVFDGAQVALQFHKRIDTVIGESEREVAGDRWLVKSSQVEIQARYMPNDQLPDRNLFVRAVAVGGSFLQGNTLVIGSLQDRIMWNKEGILNDVSSSFEARFDDSRVKATRGNHSALVQDLSKENPGVNIELPLGVSLIVNRLPQHVNVAITMSRQSDQDGICGNFNGVASDDSLEFSSQRLDAMVPPDQSLFAAFDELDVEVAA